MNAIHQIHSEAIESQRKRDISPDIPLLVLVWLAIGFITILISICIQAWISWKSDARLVFDLLVFLACIATGGYTLLQASFLAEKQHRFKAFIIFVLALVCYAVIIHFRLQEWMPEMLPGERIDHFYYWHQGQLYAEFWRFTGIGRNDCFIQIVSNAWVYGYFLGWMITLWGPFVEIPLFLGMTVLFLTASVVGTLALQLGYNSSVARRAFWIWLFLTALPQLVKPALWKDNWMWLMLALGISAIVDVAKGRASIGREFLVVIGIISTWLLRWPAALVLIGLALFLSMRTRSFGRLMLFVAVVILAISTEAMGIQEVSVLSDVPTSPMEGMILNIKSLITLGTEFELRGRLRSQLWGRPLSLSNAWYVVPLRFLEPFVAPSSWLSSTRSLLEITTFFGTKIVLFALILVLFYTLFSLPKDSQRCADWRLSRYLSLGGLPLIVSVGFYPAGSDRYILTGLLMALPLVTHATFCFRGVTRVALVLGTLLEFWAVILYLYVI